MLTQPSQPKRNFLSLEKHIIQLPEERIPETTPDITPEITSPMNRKYFLFFDFAFNNATGIKKARKAALHFIDTQLHPTDEVGVLSYSVNKGLTVHEYLTNDHQRVQEIVQAFGVKEVSGRAEDVELKYLQEFKETTEAAGGRIGLVTGRLVRQAMDYNIQVYKRQVLNFSSVLKDLAKAFRHIPGYKHVIFFSSGVANFVLYGKEFYGSEIHGYSREERFGDIDLREKYKKMAEELGASNSAVHAVNAQGIASAHFRDRAVLGHHTLQELADLSGGKYFDNINNYQGIMENIQRMTNSYYVLGYYIDEKWDGKYHKIELKVKRKGCQVYGQEGYFNPKPFTEYNELEKLLHLVDLALSENPHFQEPIHFPLVTLAYSEEEESGVVILAEIPSKRTKEMRGGKIEIVSIIFDQEDNIAKLKKTEVDSSKSTQDHIYFYTISPLSQGEYECRVVIRNLKTGRGAVASSPILIPEDPDSGLRLYPPLLLVPEQNVSYLKPEKDPVFLSEIYPFDPARYSPLIMEISKGIPRLLAVLRCTAFGIQKPELKLSASLAHSLSGEKIPLVVSILEQSQDQNTQIFLIELKIGELQPGKYYLHMFADEINTLILYLQLI